MFPQNRKSCKVIGCTKTVGLDCQQILYYKTQGIHNQHYTCTIHYTSLYRTHTAKVNSCNSEDMAVGAKRMIGGVTVKLCGEEFDSV